ncbi:MAG: cytochrome P450 [Gemmatimonadota bacterium]
MNGERFAIPGFKPEDPTWYLGDPHHVYARLRQEQPVYWHEPEGFWFLTKYADVHAVSKDPGTFCSSKGFRINDELRTGHGSDLGIPPSILGMDPPHHTRYRKLVSGYFTPRAIAKLESRVRELARESLDAISPGEVVDFVEAVSVPLPVLVIAEMLGIPTSEREQFKDWSDDLIAANDGDLEAIGRVGELFVYMIGQALARRKAPSDDLLSAVATGEPNGRPLDDNELGIFGMTLLGAGNETTRNLISGAAEALMAHPAQRAALAQDPSLLPAAIEEMLRWVSPIKSFARTATRETEIRGQRVAPNDFLVLCYSSANRDEEVFGPTASSFDVHRGGVEPHLGFGVGQHVCLGAHLARLEARVMFEELLARFPNFEVAGEVDRVRSTLINGIERMPVVFRA